LCVIGDHRAEFSEFYQEYKKQELGPTVAKIGPARGPTREQLCAELEYRKTVLTRDTERLMKHRAAVGYAASGQAEPPGRLDVGAVRAIEQMVASHKNVIQYLESQIDGE
jgi:hypothetical protein